MDNKLGFWKMKNFSEGIDEGINDGYFEDPIDQEENFPIKDNTVVKVEKNFGNNKVKKGFIVIVSRI